MNTADDLLRQANHIMRGQHDPVEWLARYDAYLSRPVADNAGGEGELVDVLRAFHRVAHACEAEDCEIVPACRARSVLRRLALNSARSDAAPQDTVREALERLETGLTRIFICSNCRSCEEVKGIPLPDGSFIFGSAVDFCSNCGDGRPYRDDGTDNGICLDELTLTASQQQAGGQ
jgi:hypothetical protein